MPSLSQLILLLSSDQPGEIAAAARAIGKRLRQEGHDWHWLAALVEAMMKNRASKSSRTTSEPFRDWGGEDPTDVADDLLSRGGQDLSDWERGFLDNIRRWRGPLTEKQEAVLSRIAAKLGWKP